jgi:hypothetical protein
MVRWVTALGTTLLAGLFLACGGRVRPSSAGAQRALVLEEAPSEQAVGEPGWLLSGGARDQYVVRRDVQGSRAAWVLEPARDTFGAYGTWMRHIDAADYRGKRVRISASLKTEGATRRADFWARAQAKDSPGDGSGLGGDHQDLPHDSDWTPSAIVMDVPSETAWLEYGVGVAGPGRIWLDGAKLEVVGNDVPLTRRERSPGNSSSHAVRGWILAGDDMPEYAIAADTSTKHAGRASGSLRALVAKPRGFGTLMQSFKEDAYLGKRLRLSAFVKANDVDGWAGLWMRVDGPNGRRSTAFDNMQDRPIKGTSDWTRYEIVLDVASEATNIAFGVLLHGAGQVWIDDVKFEIVDTNVPSTGTSSQERRKAPENLDFDL